MNISIKIDLFVSLSRQYVDLIEVFGRSRIHLLGISGEHVGGREGLGRSELDGGLSRHVDHLLLLLS